ncbi:transcriptional regulator with PAS, ATPase and Fis domain [Pullulanibacillus pueri]|uniref:ATPase AAA n=1 Tax=Pullulanibacillus pueri TaxID=1437324 RepID=A0A8J3EMQ3_9BACL|nr:sigma 54-interacting transcriptional regulator [Pullulanibacillus pueri]MBM7682856.1 transcriptional regulator with PAS, ATPase and Fis domain [Pullulanibacillus pueri]GGH84302.1 ATPase AAA [Pullulanibacillus pueri]
MVKKQLAVIGYGQSTVKTIIDQLYEIGMDDYFEFTALTIDKLLDRTLPKDVLVLVTSRVLQAMAKPYLPKETPILVAKRMINYANIRQLLELPDQMDVLLVSNMKEAAHEIKDVLIEAGINLNFFPYYPNADLPKNIRVAITPGDKEQVPETIDHVIDMGVRLLDISTIIEVFHHFGITDLPYHRLTTRYLHSLLSVTVQLNEEIFMTKMLRNSLEEIVDNVDEAVIVYNEEGIVHFINHKAIKLLEIKEEQLVGKSIHHIAKPSFLEAVKSIKNAYDVFKEIDQVTYYMQKKPIEIDQQPFGTLVMFREANEIQRLEHRYRDQSKRKNFVSKYSFDDMVATSGSIMHLKVIARKLAKSDSTILILGETGTGKEVLAQSIHHASPRAYLPFVGVNFSSFSESLLESELFGYEGGAFTGARKNGKSGLFEQAHKGTLFLDEIGDASGAIQQRLLRVLQEKEIMRVGGEQVIPVDVRIIAATNRNLEEMMEEGSFRKDLFYRLNILPLYLPPLRERKEDIEVLTELFIQEVCQHLHREPPYFTSRAKKEMVNYHWPGNVRELHNVIEYLMHIVEEYIDAEHLPFVSGSNFVNNTMGRRPDFEGLLDEFREKNFLTEMTSILEFLNMSKNCAGRPALLKGLSEKQLHLTDQQLRYRQQILRDFNLIEMHRGRKGSTITQRGKELLSYMKSVQ